MTNVEMYAINKNQCMRGKVAYVVILEINKLLGIYFLGKTIGYSWNARESFFNNKSIFTNEISFSHSINAIEYMGMIRPY